MGRKTRRARKPNNKALKKGKGRTHKKIWKLGSTIVKNGFEYALAKMIKEVTGQLRYEEKKIKWFKPRTDHTYTPDFELPNGIIIEAKGELTLEMRKKHLLVKEQHPELDIRFVFANANNKIRKGSKTTYAKWADNHGFKWAHQEIPEEWFNE